jgi:hypothetical protein
VVNIVLYGCVYSFRNSLTFSILRHSANILKRLKVHDELIVTNGMFKLSREEYHKWNMFPFIIKDLHGLSERLASEVIL